ncbi:MAG: hypothetical protein SNJ69_09000 [Chloroflexaceae bacterium]
MPYRFLSLLLGLVILLSGTLPVNEATAQAQPGQRCFTETGYCISGRIRQFWEQNGGLPVFGLPITPQQEAVVEGAAIQVQWFERNRLELHPENRAPFDVLLGRLGADRLAQQGRDWQSFPRSTARSGCRFFPETGHNVCEPILAAWRSMGIELDGRRGTSEAESLALFGLPLSDVQTETLSDGRQYRVQWFERARFELHPENRPPFNVLLGLLGSEVGPSVAAPPALPALCNAVTVIDPASPAGQAIIADFLATGPVDPGARVGWASPMDSLEGWVIFTADIVGSERGFFLMRPTAGGRYAYVIAWGGIAQSIDEVREFFRSQAPDVPPTLLQCWQPRVP